MPHTSKKKSGASYTESSTPAVKESTKKRKEFIQGSRAWTHREKRALCKALRQHGFGDTDLLSREVRTRNRSDVERFIEKWTDRVAGKQNSIDDVNLKRLFNQSKHKAINIDAYPPIALWKKVTSRAMLREFRLKNYSEIYAELFKKFQEMEPKHSNPELPDFREIYKFLHELLKGNIPPILSPLSSFTALLLMEEVMNFIKQKGLLEERKFAQEFSGPTRFTPIFKQELSDECCNGDKTSDEDCSTKPQQSLPLLITKKEHPSAQARSEDDDVPGPSTSQASAYPSEGENSEEEEDDIEENMLKLPFNIFVDMERHMKIKENLNPLLAHVYLLHKEQTLIHNHIKDLPK